MNIKRINVNGYDFEFVCDYHDTHSGFAHDCTLFIDKDKKPLSKSAAHCYYYNRTWESWTYQTVCIETVNKGIDYITSRLMRIFKENRNYKIMTQKRRADFENSIKNNEYLNALRACKDKLINRIY